MIDAIKYSLANVTNFEGRDARQTFWYYVLFLVVLQFLVSIIASIPMYVTMFSAIFDAASQGADPEIAVQAMIGDMVEQVRVQVIVGMVIGVIVALLIIASFVRRLHDAGFSGWIVLLPLATQAFSMIYSFTYLDRMEELMIESMSTVATGGGNDPLAMQAEMGGFGLVGWIGYIIVIIFGCLKSQDGPNKYGDAPVRF